MLNRALIYWGPAILIAYAFKDFAWFLNEPNYYEGLKAFIIALLFILLCEYRFFGFQIQLYPDRLIYRDRGFPFPREKSLLKKDIKSFEQVCFDKSKKIKSGHIKLNLDPECGEDHIFITLASFSQRI